MHDNCNNNCNCGDNLRDDDSKYAGREYYNKEAQARWMKLNKFRENYTTDKFMSDLENYFDGEVDFDLTRIRELISQPGKLQSLVEAATKNKSHPVSEFIRQILKESSPQ